MQGPEFIKELAERDPELFEMTQKLMKTVFTPGALDPKTKLLIAIATDAIRGASPGVENLAKQARKLGVTDAEISEALKVGYLNASMQFLSTAHAAFKK